MNSYDLKQKKKILLHALSDLQKTCLSRDDRFSYNRTVKASILPGKKK